MMHLYVFGGLSVFLLMCTAVGYGYDKATGFIRRFPKGHIREYDPDGIYTYRDQNPRYK
jgi:hypothetical protein